MKLRSIHWILALVAAVGLIAAEDTSSAKVMMEAARKKETVDGDLNGAIQQYKAIAAKFAKTDRAAAAMAIVREAEALQKLGDAQAKKLFEQIVKEYADQKQAVTIARAGLGDKQPANTKGDRAVGVSYLVGRVSPDGQLIATRGPNGGLMVHEIETNVDRMLTPNPPSYFSQWTRHAAFSRDSRQVMYEWWDQARDWRLAFRIVDLQHPSSQPKEVYFGGNDIRSTSGGLTSFDWSPDGKWIVAALRNNDKSGRIVRIAVEDGSLQVLTSMDWNVPDAIFFSPDSKYFAYDLADKGRSGEGNIFLMPIDGSRETPVVAHHGKNVLMGWSPDGARLLFTSDRTGSFGLWAQPFSAGRTQGQPELLRADAGAVFSSLGLTSSGTLYIAKRIGNRDVAVAPVDLEAGRLTAGPASFNQGFLFDPRTPVWSPDGKYLAYPVEDGNGIAIRTAATGEVRLLRPALNYVPAVTWSPNGRSLLTKGTDLKGRNGIFVIDAHSGDVNAVVTDEKITQYGSQMAEWSPDGTKVYFVRAGAITERDLASGTERVIGRGGGTVSPDGRYTATAQVQDPSTHTSTLLLRPIAGGEPRALLRITAPERFDSVREVWTPDSKAVIVVKDPSSNPTWAGSHDELWLVPISGDPPRKLDIDPSIWVEGAMAPGSNGFSLSHDGRSLAFQTGKMIHQVWAVENLLPVAATAKK